MMEKIYRVQMNKHDMPNFSTAEEVEPNLLIIPETIERGCETYIGENIVVVHHDDFIDMKCKAMMWDEYGEEPKQGEWIPCSERLPENIRPVLVTWKNNDPKSYYQYIVGKHFIGTAHYLKGKWYWYSSMTEDFLAEYGKCDTEEFDEAIEAVAWMPLPEPWKGADDEQSSN
jgi:hypothetical protein